MSPRANNLYLGLIVTALFGAGLYFIVRYQMAHPSAERVAQVAKKLELAEQVRVALVSAAEAEKSAVMAITDRESIAFADQARAATATAERDRAALAQMLEHEGTPQERERLTQFSTAFSEFQRVDKELLELAVKNTNIKATELAFGPAAKAIEDMDAAIGRLIEKASRSSASNAKSELVALAGAQAAALRIEVLLPPHIQEESDAKMDELERRMTKEDERVRASLKQLSASIAPADADLATITSSYARFTELKTRILALSRENTNVRSLSISLNQKRAVTVRCMDALAALVAAIEEERAAPVVESAPRRM